MTWNEFYDNSGPLFEPFGEPHEGANRLEVGGFVLADTFDQLLRHVSRDYLSNLRGKLEEALAKNHVIVSDLTWGCMHPGLTELTQSHAWYPSNFTGWTSRQLAPHSFSELWCQKLDATLRQLEPPLMMAFTWRSSRWNIPDGDIAAVEALIEYLWTEDTTEWVPYLEPGSPPARGRNGLWADVSDALLNKDQPAVNRLLNLAPSQYSELGCRILRLACQRVIERGGLEGGSQDQPAA